MVNENLKSFGYAAERLSGFYDADSEIKKSEIMNTADSLDIAGRVFYISESGNDDNDGRSFEKPWKTSYAIEKNFDKLRYGDTILFERGGIFRLKTRIRVKSGLSFGAYGIGAKPRLYGSVKNFASAELWGKTEYNDIWKLYFDYGDAGNIIFGNDEFIGIRKFDLGELASDGDFFYNDDDKSLYLRCGIGNPGSILNSIEIANYGNLFFVQDGAQDIHFDNLCLKYGGSHGIGTWGHNKNISVTNCELGFIGGSQQNPKKLPKLRYGNAIQFWTSAEDCIIENNWVHDVYDAGLTFQGDYEVANYKNLSFCNNLIEYCTYNFEFFDREPESVINDVRVCNNIMRFSGYGWGNQRPDKWATAHINGWSFFYKNLVSMYICNNVFDCADYNFVYWYWDNEKRLDNLTVLNNSYFQKQSGTNYSLRFQYEKQSMANDQAQFEKSVSLFDEKPRIVIYK